MRVAFVSLETVHHRETETNQRLQSVLECLRDAGHDVHLFCARFWKETCRRERDDSARLDDAADTD